MPVRLHTSFSEKRRSTSVCVPPKVEHKPSFRRNQKWIKANKYNSISYIFVNFAKMINRLQQKGQLWTHVRRTEPARAGFLFGLLRCGNRKTQAASAFVPELKGSLGFAMGKRGRPVTAPVPASCARTGRFLPGASRAGSHRPAGCAWRAGHRPVRARFWH